MKTDDIAVEDQKKTDIREITLHNGRANSLTADLLRQLEQAVTDARGRRKILLTAKGEQFCVGLDRFDLYKTIVRNRTCAPLVEQLLRVYRAILTHDQPTACVVHEGALGGGVGLAACFDYVTAWRGVTFKIPSGGYRPLALVLIPILDLRAHRFGLSYFAVDEWIGVDVKTDEALRRGLVNEEYDLSIEGEEKAFRWLVAQKNKSSFDQETFRGLEMKLDPILKNIGRPEICMGIGLGIVSDLLDRLTRSLA